MGKKRLANSDEDDSDYVPLKIEKRVKKRIIKKNGDIACLPESILMNIFFLIPAEDLHNSVRFVCKSWWNTIQDPYFIDHQLAYSKSNLIFEAIDNKEKMINTILLKINHGSQVKPKRKINRGSLNTTSILCKRRKCCEGSCSTLKASCNGLVLILFHDNLIVTNPITKWFLKLPPFAPVFSDIGWPTKSFGLAYDHLAKEYKVTITFEGRCAIHTVCSDSWKEVKMPGQEVKFYSSPISTSDGALHWLCSCTTKKHLESNECLNWHILSMEVSSENFRVTRDPPDSRIDQLNSSLIELGGSLSLFHYVTMIKTDVWVLEDYHKQVWVKKYCIDPTDRLAKKSLQYSHAFVSLHKGEVVIFVDTRRNQLFKYDLKLQELKQVRAHLKHVEHHHRHSFYMEFPCAHTNSLVSPGNILVKKL